MRLSIIRSTVGLLGSLLLLLALGCNEPTPQVEAPERTTPLPTADQIKPGGEGFVVEADAE